MQDLNDLRFFAAVVSSGGFSKAARDLGLPKSRLSRRIAQLEADLGVRLLERSTRRLKVTEVGQEVYAQAVAAAAAGEAAAEAALRVRAEPQGLVRMSCPLNLHDAIARRLPAFLTDHPRLRLQILSTNRRVDLIEERIDVAVRVRERLDTDGDLQMRRIGVSRRIVVASPGFVRDYGEPRTPQDLAGLPLVDANEGAGQSVWRLSAGDARHGSIEFDARLAAGDLKTLLAARPRRGGGRPLAGDRMPGGSRSGAADPSVARVGGCRRHPPPCVYIASKHAAQRPRGDRFRGRGVDGCGSVIVLNIGHDVAKWLWGSRLSSR
jgi:DNA-binding transcriptional LysR family regulator